MAATNHRGSVCHFRHLAPAAVARLAAEAAAHLSDIHGLRRDMRGDGHWAQPIFWDAIRPALRTVKPGWSSHARAALRSLVANTTWTQARLFRHGFAAHEACTLCHAGCGTLWHRNYECAAHAVRRGHAVSARLQRCAEATLRHAGRGAAELFARGIFPDPAALFPRRAVAAEDRVRWVNRPADGKLRGLLFLDGSAFWPRLGAAKRAGWAIVQTTAEGDLVAAAYGPVPFDQCPFQEARDGEDFAAHMCAFLTEGPVEAYIDCQGTLDSINNLAKLFYEMGKLDEAESGFVEAVDGRREVLGEDHPDTRSAEEWLDFLRNEKANA